MNRFKIICQNKNDRDRLKKILINNTECPFCGSEPPNYKCGMPITCYECVADIMIEWVVLDE